MFKPTLAHTVKDPAKIKFPVVVSPKLDGIRCVIVNGRPVTRSLKDIPNEFVRSELAKVSAPELDGLDGELIVGRVTAPDVFTRTTSGVMSKDGEPDFTFYVFDRHTVPGGFSERLDTVSETGRVKLVRHWLVADQAELDEAEADCLAQGFEGLMIRAPYGPYKMGRSTEREGTLGKVKRFSDCEGEVVGFEELMVNGNEAVTNRLGRTERSTSKDGLEPGGTLGALIVSAPGWKVTFKIGTGFDAAQRALIWGGRERLMGSSVKFKHQPSGADKAPRFPVFLGFRSDL